jgi:Leucine-rich repeat (LRR) protein
VFRQWTSGGNHLTIRPWCPSRCALRSHTNFHKSYVDAFDHATCSFEACPCAEHASTRERGHGATASHARPYSDQTHVLQGVDGSERVRFDILQDTHRLILKNVPFLKDVTILNEAIRSLTRLASLRELKVQLSQDRVKGSLKILPAAVGELRNLTALDLRGCGLTSLPPAIRDLADFESLDLAGCGGLLSLPPAIVALPRLKALDETRCDSLPSLATQMQG